MQNKVQSPSASALHPSEQSEIDRSGTGSADTFVLPDPEVVVRAKRRRFTARYKQQILTKADAAASESGAIGALLRREGLYSSHLVKWRRDRETSIQQGLEPKKRGPKSKRNVFADQNQTLQRENDRLTEQLRRAELIIDVQKKVAALLGSPIPMVDSRGRR